MPEMVHGELDLEAIFTETRGERRDAGVAHQDIQRVVLEARGDAFFDGGEGSEIEVEEGEWWGGRNGLFDLRDEGGRACGGAAGEIDVRGVVLGEGED